LRAALVFRINIAGRWRGFNRNEEGRRELPCNQAYFEQSPPPSSAAPARLCRTSNGDRQAGRSVDFCTKAVVPQCTNWHIKCLVRIGRWWPGTFVETSRRFPTFRIINSRESSMTKYKLEYIWLDGYTPIPNLRGKTQIKEFDSFPTLDQLPLWGFDGSSTMQAEGKSSDCVLKPVAVFPDAARTNGALVMCEVMMPDGKTPHASNKRATILDDAGAWFGFEQEYFFYKDGRPLGFPTAGYPAPQGPYYTGVGYSNVGAVAREIVEKHLDLCLAAGINHEGINAEVAKGQWEFQIFGKGSKKAADEMWMARYLMQRLTESYGIDIEYHCKPLGDTDWNGSGMHANFSTAYMRETGGKEYFEKLMAAFEAARADHIAVYGPDNHLRLTGKHETASINEFSYGIADRGASIRVPHSFANSGYKGYLEDRRPNSQGDPYQIASQILKTIASVPTAAKAAAA
jgi:glutamine synthetase